MGGGRGGSLRFSSELDDTAFTGGLLLPLSGFSIGRELERVLDSKLFSGSFREILELLIFGFESGFLEGGGGGPLLFTFLKSDVDLAFSFWF